MLYDRIDAASKTRGAVLTAGESGTGMELFARALHEAGLRQAASFIAFNCAAIPKDLIESELFGYRHGAFSSANTEYPGLFRTAEGVTLFLDKITEMRAGSGPSSYAQSRNTKCADWIGGPPPSIIGRGSSISLSRSNMHAATGFNQPPLSVLGTFADVERDLILRALKACDWNKVHAATMLKISRKKLYAKISKYQIEQSN